LGHLGPKFTSQNDTAGRSQNGISAKAEARRKKPERFLKNPKKSENGIGRRQNIII
jgi:hypothetical protein